MGIRDVVLVRTLNEVDRIDAFCTSYRDAWRILVADGGSTDSTKVRAEQYANTIVLDYPRRVQLQNGYWRNNDSDHVNWVIDQARAMNPDWIILDDCDCRPNWLLRQNYRKILWKIPQDFVMVTRIYFWGLKQHFPHLAKPGAEHTQWEPSLWAWRGLVDFKTVDVPPAFTFRIGDQPIRDLHYDASTLDLFPPFALLHYPWWPFERMEMKLRTYRESGLIPGMLHPLEFGGPLAPIEWWMKE